MSAISSTTDPVQGRVATSRGLGEVRHHVVAVAITAVLLATLIGWPVLAVQRARSFSDANGFVPSALDPILVVGAVVWIGIVAALVVRSKPLRRVALVPPFVQTAFRSVVEKSYFGAGPPTFVSHAQSAPLSAVVGAADVVGDFVDDEEPAPELVEQPAVAASSIQQVRTVARLTVRSDTWWSLAEQLFGDGREWTVLRDLNLGRTLAPGVVCDESTMLLPGWTVHVPVAPKEL